MLESLEVLQHAASGAALSCSSSTQHFRLCSHGNSSRLRAHITVSSPLSLTYTPELICSVQLEPQTHQLNWHSTFGSLVFQNAQGLLLLHPIRESLQQKIPGSMKAAAIITGSHIWFIVEQSSPSVRMKYSQGCMNRCLETPRPSISSLVDFSRLQHEYFILRWIGMQIWIFWTVILKFDDLHDTNAQ